jgi:hypothetical protein
MNFVVNIPPGAVGTVKVYLTRINTTDSIWGFKNGIFGDVYKSNYSVNYIPNSDLE